VGLEPGNQKIRSNRYGLQNTKKKHISKKKKPSSKAGKRRQKNKDGVAHAIKIRKKDSLGKGKSRMLARQKNAKWNLRKNYAGKRGGVPVKKSGRRGLHQRERSWQTCRNKKMEQSDKHPGNIDIKYCPEAKA